MTERPSHLVLRCTAPVGVLRIDVQIALSSAWTVLFGPSGSGKSSLLRLAAGLWTPRDAEVRLCQADVTATPAHRRGIVLVAQQPALFPHLNVAGNVGFACRGGQKSLEALLELFELRGLQKARVAELSGGERQRVALARALAAEPRILLLDEVFNGMHRAQRETLLQRLKSHCEERGVPVVSVTHDVAEAFASAGEVLRLREGRVVAQGPADTVLDDERSALLRTLR